MAVEISGDGPSKRFWILNCLRHRIRVRRFSIVIKVKRLKGGVESSERGGDYSESEIGVPARKCVFSMRQDTGLRAKGFEWFSEFLSGLLEEVGQRMDQAQSLGIQTGLTTG